MKFYNFQIIIEPEKNPQDGYYAYCPQLPGCYSNGATIEETRTNIRQAIQLHLSTLQETKQSLSDILSLKPKSIYKEELMIALP